MSGVPLEDHKGQIQPSTGKMDPTETKQNPKQNSTYILFPKLASILVQPLLPSSKVKNGVEFSPPPNKNAYEFKEILSPISTYNDGIQPTEKLQLCLHQTPFHGIVEIITINLVETIFYSGSG